MCVNTYPAGVQKHVICCTMLTPQPNNHLPAWRTIPVAVYALAVCIGLCALSTLLASRADITYAINGLHSPLLDAVAKYLTHAGDGFFAVAVALLWLFKNKKEALYIFACYGISALITQFLKHQVFDDALRPIMALDASRLHFIDGVTVHRYLSFPSGHATTALALGTALCMCTPTRLHALICTIALLSALTRIYLLQHYITDVAAGASIGYATALVLQLTLFHVRKVPTH
jgi:membrane-associated phospholipid phosphatase